MRKKKDENFCCCFSLIRVERPKKKNKNDAVGTAIEIIRAVDWISPGNPIVYWVLLGSFFSPFFCASGAVGVFFYFAGEIFLLVVVTKKKTRHSADRILRVVILIFVSIFLLFRK